MKINLEELKFKFRESKNEIKVVLKYFFMEPYYEFKKLLSGYYDSTLMFWISIFLYIFLWKKNIGGYKLKTAGFLIIVMYFYHFYKSGAWKEYYEEEFIRGKKN